MPEKLVVIPSTFKATHLAYTAKTPDLPPSCSTGRLNVATDPVNGVVTTGLCETKTCLHRTTIIAWRDDGICQLRCRSG